MLKGKLVNTSDTYPETVYLVTDATSAVSEIFVLEQDARQFASHLPDPSIEPMRLRASLQSAQTVTERRAVVGAGRSLVDEVFTTLVFANDGLTSMRIGEADVEGFRCSHGHWHVLGMGIDHAAVIERTQAEIDRALHTEEPAHRSRPSRRDTCEAGSSLVRSA